MVMQIGAEVDSLHSGSMDVEDESLVQCLMCWQDAVYSYRQFLQLNRWKKKQEESLVTDQVPLKQPRHFFPI